MIRGLDWLEKMPRAERAEASPSPSARGLCHVVPRSANWGRLMPPGARVFSRFWRLYRPIRDVFSVLSDCDTVEEPGGPQPPPRNIRPAGLTTFAHAHDREDQGEAPSQSSGSTVYYGRKASGESPQGPPPIPVDTDSCFAACTVIICMNAEASESPLVPAPEPPKTVVGTLRLANASAQTFWVST